MFHSIKHAHSSFRISILLRNQLTKRYNANNITPKQFSFKTFTDKITILDNASNNLKQYYEKNWFYPVTKYPAEYYNLEKIYLRNKNENKNSIFKTIKYQYKKNMIIFKLFLTNYKNTAWYILNFRIKSSFYNDKMAGYNLDETLKNITFKIIEEENQLSFIQNANNQEITRDTKDVIESMNSLSNEPTCVIGDIDVSKFIPYHIDKEWHSIISHFLKVSFLVILLEEMSLILFKLNIVKPPFFAHLPETLAKQIDSENYNFFEKILKNKSKKMDYLTPDRFHQMKEYKKYHNIITNNYMNFIYLDDLCFIKKLAEINKTKSLSLYREELIYKCNERFLFPDNYKIGTYLSIPSEILLDMYMKYLDSRYSQTLMPSANGLHNIYDLSL
ncbi:hypothetical protein ACO0SA_000114 [Hanseniaspora valbyensis]